MDINDTLAALSALAQPTRIGIFQLAARHEPAGLPAGEIARQLDVPQNTLSSHLAVLTRAGLLRSERHGRSIVYRADIAALRSVTDFLLRDCCGGQTDLCPPDAPTCACVPA